MTRKHYNQLRDNLKDEFKKANGYDYSIVDGVGNWITQSGIRLRKAHVDIICKIFGSVPYPYIEKDRLFILSYLRRNRYSKFYKSFKEL